MNSIYSKFTQIGQAQYPSCEQSLVDYQCEYLVCARSLRLGIGLLRSAQRTIELLYRLGHSGTLTKRLTAEFPQLFTAAASPASVLMAYDFHSDSQGGLHLIEINTNASGYLISDLIQQTHGREERFQQLLRQSFFAEAKPSIGQAWHSAIVDREIQKQKMYPEFLMYQQLFQSWGWTCELVESNELSLDQNGKLLGPLGRPIDFVYNRSTDFLLEEPESAALRKSFVSGKVRLSPHPQEFLRLATKERLADFRGPLSDELSREDQDFLRKIIPETRLASEFRGIEELWPDRKRWFFKPSRSHGGKSAFRGESVSRKMLESIWAPDLIVQEYFPAESIQGEDGPWKFDLRFYVYRDQVHMAMARVYRGQVTNFSTIGGGLARVDFEP